MLDARRSEPVATSSGTEASFAVRSVCVFCGSSEGGRPAYAKAARGLGEEVATRGMRLVYGGGKVGLMGVVADAALRSGGEVIGVMPEALLEKEIGHRSLTDLKVVSSMHERKALMAELAGGFVALPGGYGTLEEFLEVLSWAQLSYHEKPCALLDVEGFFGSLLHLFDRAVEEGFVHPDHRALVLSDTDPRALLDAMVAYEPPTTKKWVSPGEL
jgi:uncharacterized protein (TIGR00730 family)